MLYYSWKFVISALALNILRSPSVLSQCEPIEEGKSHTITCSGAACNNPLLYKWSTFPARPASQHIAHCDTTMDCTGNNNFFAIDVAQDGVGYISNLTIRRVSLTEPFNNELTWTCDYCGQRVKSCALQIFVKPVEPKCQASEITDGNGVLSKLKLSCSMERVYPTARCLFQKVAKNDSIVTLQQTVNSCNNTIDVSEFHDGVNMIQAIVGSTRQPDFDQIQPIRVSPDIRLRLPTSSVECPE